MMQKYKMRLEECLQKIREKRPCIEPNFSFKKELLKLEDNQSLEK